MEDSGALESLLPIIFCIIFILIAAFLLFLLTALTCCRKARLRLFAEKGEEKYNSVLDLLEKIDLYQAALRYSIIFFAFIGFLGGIIHFRIYPAYSLTEFFILIIFLLLGGGILFIFIELLREIARSVPEKIIAFFLPLIKILYILSYPLLAVNNTILNLTGRFFRTNDTSDIAEDELRIALLEGEKSGVMESNERTMVEGVFYLGDRPVGNFMIHRSDIQWLDLDTESEKLKETVENAEAQRYFPVSSGDLDKVSGVVSIEDILLALLRGPWPGLKPLIKPPFFIPETMPALKSFEAFKKAESHCLFVMDEYGGFAGMLTVQNLIEEIVGQLSIKEGEGEKIITKEEGSWLADGSINIDTAAEALSLSSLDVDEGHSEYHTLAGFILNLAGEIPKIGAFFDYHGFRFTVAAMDGNRIDKIAILKLGREDFPPL